MALASKGLAGKVVGSDPWLDGGALTVYVSAFRCTHTLFTRPSANMIINTNDPL